MISWINYEKETRLEHMAKLMEHVRLPLLPRDYLVQVSPVCRAEPFPAYPGLQGSQGQPCLYGVEEELSGPSVRVRASAFWAKWEVR